jgi:biopolymer transport protein TolR
MMMQGLEVNLPQTTTKPIKTPDEPLVLTINKEREIFLENRKFDLNDLEPKIRKIFENRREKELLLRADRDVSYGLVVDVMARVKRAGIDKLGMVTEPTE